MKPEPFDVQTASEVELQAFYEFCRVIDQELDPETPNWPVDVWTSMIKRVSPFRENIRFVVWNDARDAIVADAGIQLNRTDENRHLAGFAINVLPAQRRAGLGRSLLGEITAVAEADARTTLGAGTVRDHDAEEFLAAMSFENKMLERRSRCHINPIPQDLLDDWITTGEAKGGVGGYELLCFDGPIPAEHRAKFISVTGIMNDAPRDDLDMEDWNLTEERLADSERLGQENGERVWTMVVNHAESDTFVSFSGVEWHPAVPQVLWQGGTAVRPEHRGHAIGRWIKAAMIQKIRTELPEAEFIDTWNAGSNKWMLQINDDLGFAPYIWYTDWQAKVVDVKTALAS